MEVTPGGLQPQFSSLHNFTTKSVLATCCMKFTRFEFLRHKARTKMTFSFHCHIVYLALANCLHYNIGMNQYLLRVHPAGILSLQHGS